jgi:type I restriction enzyme R subunit
MTQKITEKSLEDYIVEKLQEKGWKFVKAEELECESLEEPLLVNNLVRAIKRINAISLSDEDIKNVLNQLKLKSSTAEGIKDVLNFLKNGISIKLEKTKELERIKLFDFSNINNNEFIVSRQVWLHGKEKRRLDIALFVNGIPLVNIECKDPTNPEENWYNAYKQILEYQKVIPEFYKYAQIGVAVCEVAKYFPITPWQEEKKEEEKKEEEEKEEEKYIGWYEWKEPEKLIENSIDATIEMLNPEKLLDIIKNFVFVREFGGIITKVVPRYMQYRAANKIVDRVLATLRGKDNKKKGLIWHWQGSGKTLTMIFAANKLYNLIELQNPTIFFIVDRDELGAQLNREYNALDIPKPEVINSVEELKKVLKHDGYRGKRGIFITLIHKFQPKEFEELQKELEKISEKRETILNRKNVICFIDEGHRTQYGILAAQMKSILRNAFYFAFTGTPLAKLGRDTYLEFSEPSDERKYLDKYFIDDSIKDGFTLKIVYQPRLEDEKGIKLEKDLLDTFLKSELEELPEELKVKVEKKVKKKLNKIKIFLENRRRINLIAQDIKKHFDENVRDRFKAMIVAGSRLACVRYKEALDKLLPEDETEVVMTFNQNDPKEILEYLDKLKSKYKGKEIEDIRKEIREKFITESDPKILIVTDMLLTGFDAPILQVMYLDKPLKEHRLLQAIARTNRPHQELKEYGLVIDYIGLFGEIEKAFKIYEKEDVKAAIFSMDEIRKEFIELMQKTLEPFKNIKKEGKLEELREAFDIITSNEDITREFLSNYRKLRKLFELLGPDIEKTKWFNLFKWLSGVYIYHRRLADGKEESIEAYVQKYFRRTLDFIYETTEFNKIKENLPILSIDENYLKKLEEKFKTLQEKAANILFTLNRFVLVEKHAEPIYETIAEKVKRLLEEWKDRTKNYEEIYQKSITLLQGVLEIERKKKELGSLEYSILYSLEETNIKVQLKEIKELIEKIKPYMFRNWQVQITARKNIAREIIRFLRKYSLKQEEREKLSQKIMRCIENYGEES